MNRNRKEDRELWERVKSTVSPSRPEKKSASQFIEPFAKAVNAGFEPRKSEARFERRIPDTKEPVTVNLAPRPKIIDPAISRKIARGRIAIEGKIDLHGMTQLEAHQQLWQYLHYAHQAGKRTVLVITGKGVGGQGVLRRSVPRWLDSDSFRQLISGTEEAQLAHGGSGALYVRLRRRQEKIGR